MDPRKAPKGVVALISVLVIMATLISIGLTIAAVGNNEAALSNVIDDGELPLIFGLVGDTRDFTSDPLDLLIDFRILAQAGLPQHFAIGADTEFQLLFLREKDELIARRSRGAITSRKRAEKTGHCARSEDSVETDRAAHAPGQDGPAPDRTLQHLREHRGVNDFIVRPTGHCGVTASRDT